MSEPRIQLRHVEQAYRDWRRFTATGNPTPDDLAEFMERGGVDARSWGKFLLDIASVAEAVGEQSAWDFAGGIAAGIYLPYRARQLARIEAATVGLAIESAQPARMV